MVRVLVMIAVAGFFVSLVTLSTAVAIGGPALLEDAAWGGWDGHWIHHRTYVSRSERWGRGEDGPQTSRDFAWTGGDTLEIDALADVHYTQGPVGKVTVSGPERLVSEVELDGGRLAWRSGHHRRWNDHWGDLVVTMTAPNVRRFEISGSGDLSIANYKQESLDLRITGNGDVDASGETDALALNISGSGDADLSRLKARSADVDISGSGDAKVAPSDAAKIDVSGSGDVTLLTHPPRLQTNISGSGDLHQDAAPAQAAEPSPAPAPAPKRARKG